MERLSDLTNRIEAERRTRPLVRAICAMGEDPFHERHNAMEIAKARWPNDRATVVTIEKAAVVPTSATTIGYTSTAVPDLVNLLGPLSCGGAIFSRSLQFSFKGATSILIPTVTASPSGVGFIGQGAPIPMRQMNFSGPTMTAKKLALGYAMTRELFEGSNAEAITRANTSECLSLGIDALLLDATAADTLRPAGLRSGVTATTATVIGTPVLTASDAMFKDLSNLAAAVAPIAGSQFNIIFVASPGEAVKIALRTNSSFPYEVFSSAALASGTVLCLAVNALAVAADPSPQFSVSKTTAYHSEDTTPLAIANAGAVAAPVFSAFQDDLVAVKLIQDLNWALRVATPSAAVAWTQSVIW
jgi:hypothetical protein